MISNKGLQDQADYWQRVHDVVYIAWYDRVQFNWVDLLSINQVNRPKGDRYELKKIIFINNFVFSFFNNMISKINLTAPIGKMSDART